MRNVAIIGEAQTEFVAGDPAVDAVELVLDVATRALAAAGLPHEEVDLVVEGSSDMLEGRSFNFVFCLEGAGAQPPVSESHLEMDGAWAAYYAWLRILAGAAQTALVVAWGKSSEGSLAPVLNTQLDPFCLAPLGLDHIMTSALQAQAFLARTGLPDRCMDEVVDRARGKMGSNPHLRRMTDDRPDRLLASPLWTRHCPPVTDGACAVVLAAEEIASGCDRPVWIRGADHRAESGGLGHRDLSRLPGASTAATRCRQLAGWDDTGVDLAELGASYAHQEPLLTEALGLGPRVALNPSGGPLVADPLMATGLVRLAEASIQLRGQAGAHQVPDARRALAHASTGHAMQQNIVWLLEGAVP